MAVAVMVLGAPARGEAQCDAADRQLFGVNVDPANPGGDPSGAELQSLGARWVRMEYRTWAAAGTYEARLAAMHAAGLRVLLIVDYASLTDAKPRSDTPVGEWGAYTTAFATAVDGIATRLPGVDAWEVWNEPDLNDPGGGYDPGVPAAVLGPMLIDVQAVIRAHSAAPIVVGGLASGDAGYVRALVAAAGGTRPWDAVGVHPYGQRAPDGWPDATWGFGDMSDVFDRYLVEAGTPLWVTEIGTIDSPRHADYVRNVYALTRDRYLADVPHVFWFCWSDAMVPPFGLVDAAGAHKPAWDAYAETAPPFDLACAPGGPTDADGDGFDTGTDCDDARADVHPGAVDPCGDGVDQDCSGADTACASGPVTFATDPVAPVEGDTVTVTATGAIGYTNVELLVAGPGGAATTTWIGVDSDAAGFHWHWSFVAAVAGDYTLTFRADPGATVYGTAPLRVAPRVAPDAGLVAPGSDGGIRDAGRQDAASAGFDGGARSDAGAPRTGGSGVESGCSCRASGARHGGPGHTLALTLLFAGATVSRRWRRARRLARR